jgi:hypothetical protein
MYLTLPQHEKIHDTPRKKRLRREKASKKSKIAKMNFLNSSVFLENHVCAALSFGGQVLSFCKLVPLIVFKWNGAFVTRHPTHGEIRTGTTAAKTKSGI